MHKVPALSTRVRGPWPMVCFASFRIELKHHTILHTNTTQLLPTTTTDIHTNTQRHTRTQTRRGVKRARRGRVEKTSVHDEKTRTHTHSTHTTLPISHATEHTTPPHRTREHIYTPPYHRQTPNHNTGRQTQADMTVPKNRNTYVTKANEYKHHESPPTTWCPALRRSIVIWRIMASQRISFPVQVNSCSFHVGCVRLQMRKRGLDRLFPKTFKRNSVIPWRTTTVKLNDVPAKRQVRDN